MNTFVIQFISIKEDCILETINNCTFVPRVGETIFLTGRTYSICFISYVVENHMVHGLRLCACVYCDNVIEKNQSIQNRIDSVKQISRKDM